MGAGLAGAAGYLGGHLAFGSQDPVSETRSTVDDTLLEDDTLLIVSEVFVVEGTDGADLTDRS